MLSDAENNFVKNTRIKYFLCCIICISNGSLNLICFILAHVILYFCNSYPCLYALVGEIKFIYLFICLFIIKWMKYRSVPSKHKNANMGPSTIIHLHGIDMTCVISEFTIKTYFCMICNTYNYEIIFS